MHVDYNILVGFLICQLIIGMLHKKCFPPKRVANSQVIRSRKWVLIHLQSSVDRDLVVTTHSNVTILLGDSYNGCGPLTVTNLLYDSTGLEVIQYFFYPTPQGKRDWAKTWASH